MPLLVLRHVEADQRPLVVEHELRQRPRQPTIGTFDERHFRAAEPLAGGPAFRLVPADA